jgi:hypothetical protein
MLGSEINDIDRRQIRTLALLRRRFSETKNAAWLFVNGAWGTAENLTPL